MIEIQELSAIGFNLWIFVSVNYMAFYLVKKDKKLDEAKQDRLSEYEVLLPILGGGLIGFLIGKHYYSDKTKKGSFTLKLTIFIILHLIMCLIVINFGSPELPEGSNSLGLNAQNVLPKLSFGLNFLYLFYWVTF